MKEVRDLEDEEGKDCEEISFCIADLIRRKAVG
jgi:hypothetical protein